MMRYVFYALRKRFNITDKRSFAECIKLGTYGDDNAMGVKPTCTYYTHTLCQEEFERIGIKYTMAQKDAVSRPYIPLSELSFLKRSFAWHDELETWVAPIEMESTIKKFHFVKKPNESPLNFCEQFAAHLDSALRDSVLRGKDEYESFVGKIRRIVDRNPDLRMHVILHTYKEMLDLIRPNFTTTGLDYHDTLFENNLTMENCYDTLH